VANILIALNVVVYIGFEVRWSRSELGGCWAAM